MGKHHFWGHPSYKLMQWAEDWQINFNKGKGILEQRVTGAMKKADTQDENQESS